MTTDPKKFAGKVVIVTGSSSGIGQGVALLFGEQGANVTIHGLDAEEVQDTYNLMITSGIPAERILTVAGNFFDSQTADNLVNETIAKWEKLDVLVNNAGVGVKGGIPADSDENYEFIFGINFKSIVRMIQIATPHLEKTRGCIVNTCSIAALRRFPEVSTFYATSKVALEHYVKYESPKLARRGIRMNNIAPGTVPTNILVRLGVSQEKFAENAQVKNIPLGRLGTPRDCANAVSFLASNEASYVCGTTLVVDGGLMHGILEISLLSTDRTRARKTILKAYLQIN